MGCLFLGPWGNFSILYLNKLSEIEEKVLHIQACFSVAWA